MLTVKFLERGVSQFCKSITCTEDPGVFLLTPIVVSVLHTFTVRSLIDALRGNTFRCSSRLVSVKSPDRPTLLCTKQADKISECFVNIVEYYPAKKNRHFPQELVETKIERAWIFHLYELTHINIDFAHYVLYVNILALGLKRNSFRQFAIVKIVNSSKSSLLILLSF